MSSRDPMQIFNKRITEAISKAYNIKKLTDKKDIAVFAYKEVSTVLSPLIIKAVVVALIMSKIGNRMEQIEKRADPAQQNLVY